MANRGRLVAADSDGKRLARMEERLARSGAAIVERRVVGDDLAGLGEFDRVLVDAPCSGSGTWRRAPDAKWRLTPERLAHYRASQADLLARAADRVAPSGRLVYAVCSILPGEGEDQAARFLAARPDFRAVAPADLWAGIAPGSPPGPGPDLVLTPHRHGTDGFYAAVFARRA
jgi:16S rRNA (cytosine967-C5)-methyltransferase